MNLLVTGSGRICKKCPLVGWDEVFDADIHGAL